jgi:hypothetical protein
MTSLTCRLGSSLSDEQTDWACVGRTGKDLDSVGAVWVPGEVTLDLFSAMTLTVTCRLGLSVFKLKDWELEA